MRHRGLTLAHRDGGVERGYIDVGIGHTHCHDAYLLTEGFRAVGVFYVLEVSGGGVDTGEIDGEFLATLYPHRAPRDLLHGIVGSDPGTARVAPAWRTGDGHRHAQRVGNVHGVAEAIFPLGRHVRDAVGHYLRRVQTGIEDMDTGYSGAVHPLQVFLDAILGDIAVHPVPPHTRSRLLGRVGKLLLQVALCHAACSCGQGHGE